MDTALPHGPILPLIDELTDALVTGRVSPVGSSADGEPWGYWSCSIDRRDGEYAISEWRIGWPVYVRVLHLDLRADDAFMLPVLAEDYAVVMGRAVAGVALQPARAAS